MLLSKLAARPNKSGIAPHVETSDRELRVCAPRVDTAQTGEPARPPPLVNAQKTPCQTANRTIAGIYAHMGMRGTHMRALYLAAGVTWDLGSS